MERGRLRVLLFRIILFVTVIILLEAVGYAALWLNSRSFDFLANKSYFHIRAMLMGNNNPDMLPRYLTLPYLGYVPYPGYRKNGVIQHNEDGYRGRKVLLQKTGKFRVLCLGGSATYGFGVDSPSQAFPAQLENLLDEGIARDSTLRSNYTGAEVINAGLDAGTSAEELQQYLFKYRYYHPDAVIVHSGVNDAMLVQDSPDFQLDYTHYRRLNFHLEPLSAPMRWFLHSYFVSYLSIRLFYDQFSVEGDEFKHQGRQKFCHWTHLDIDSVLGRKQYAYYPFYQNTRCLYQQIAADSAYIFTFPTVLNRDNEFVKSNDKYVMVNSLNASIAESLCKEFGGYSIPFTFDSIKNTASWLDDCHVDAAGEKEKARLLYRALMPVLNRRTPKN
jgi:lysophospholipase L1-like esterase